MRRLIWPVVAAGLALAAFGVVPLHVVGAPLLGLAILRVGLASFGSLRAGGAHIPEGPARPVDPRRERTTYWCEGCGAEMLLLARGTPLPPRHCGEKMIERTEVARVST